MTVGARLAVPPRRRALVMTVAVLVILVIVFGAFSSLYTEVLWYDEELGSSEVFWTGLWTRLGLGGAFGVAFAILLLLNLWIARKITNPSRLFTVPDAVLERYRASLQPYTRWIVIGGAALFGLFAGSGASVQWRSWLLFSNATSFGRTDPVFERDIGFYVFKLPFHQFLFTWTFSALLVATLATVGAHYVFGGIRPQARSDRVAPEVRAHLSVLLGLIVLLKAWGYRLDQFNLLYSPRGQVTGASYTDINAQLPALKLLVVIAIACSIFFFVNARIKNWILPIAGIGLLGLTSILAGGAYPALVQRFRVTPNEQTLEAPFIDRNLKGTRAAYGLENVEQRPFAGRAALTARDIQRNRETIENVRLWDPGILIDQYRSLQRIKQYYEFNDVDVDRYTFDDGQRQVMLSAREIGLLQAEASTWLNEHLVYTHGYGVAASRTDRVVGSGQPDFVLRDIPPLAEEPELEVEQPQVYYGESGAPEFVLVNTETPELDYPQGDSFVPTNYDGEGGVTLSGILRRSAFAWRFRDINLLISGSVTPESRVLFRRNVIERARRAAPFLLFDKDPYITIVDGRLVWMVDAYTTTEMYPYSQRIAFPDVTGNVRLGSGNYIRNAAKFTIDAKDGTVTGYVWDDEDPIVQAWMKVFPDVLRPRDEMPPAVLEHVRYPEDLYMIQTDRYATYHITSPDNFYSKEDVWTIARNPTSQDVVPSPVPPYYVLQRLPGEEGLDFVLVRPFTPADRQNMTAFMVAHSDPRNYGRLVSYVFPKSETIPGPQLIQSRINSDTTVSSLRSLLDRQGSRIIEGNFLIIPLEDSLLYVHPWYVVGQGSSLPELRRVIVVHGSTVRMATTLPEALSALFRDLPRSDGGGGEEPGVTVADLLQQALDHFQRAQEALRNGDLAEYERQHQLAQDAIERAGEIEGVEPEPEGEPSPQPS